MTSKSRKPAAVDGGHWFINFFVRSVFVLLLVSAVIVFAAYGLIFSHK